MNAAASAASRQLPTLVPCQEADVRALSRRRLVPNQFGKRTKRDYTRQVRDFTAFLGVSPDRAEPEPEDLRRYQLHLASLGASYSRMNMASTALRFFFHVTLGRAGFGDRMARIRRPSSSRGC